MDMEMDQIARLRWVPEDSWIAHLAGLLPLWLLALSILPRPDWLSLTAIILLFPVSIILLWKLWLTFDVLFISLFPILFIFIFSDISMRYRVPFVLICVTFLSIGIVGAQRSKSLTVRWLILLAVAVAALVLANHAAHNFWQMAGSLGYVDCSPDALGCPPLTGDETPWWVLYFN
jgi:hypothetical protein